MAETNITTQDLSTGHSYRELDMKIIGLWEAYRTIAGWTIKLTIIGTVSSGIMSNIALLLYLIKSGKYKIPVFTIFTSLCICDLLTCLSGGLNIVLFHPNAVFQKGSTLIFKVTSYLAQTSYESSICHLIFLAGMRYCQLCHPLWAKVYVTSRIVFILCMCMWCICIIAAIPFPICYQIYWLSYNDMSLGIYYFSGNNDVKELILSIFCQDVPLLVLTLLHGLKIYNLKQNSELLSQDRRNASSSIVRLIIVLFVLSILPRFGHGMYHSVLGYPLMSLHFYILYYACAFSYLNSVLNPWVYLFGSRQIRRNGIDTFCPKAKPEYYPHKH